MDIGHEILDGKYNHRNDNMDEEHEDDHWMGNMFGGYHHGFGYGDNY